MSIIYFQYLNLPVLLTAWLILIRMHCCHHCSCLWALYKKYHSKSTIRVLFKTCCFYLLNSMVSWHYQLSIITASIIHKLTIIILSILQNVDPSYKSNIMSGFLAPWLCKWYYFDFSLLIFSRSPIFSLMLPINKYLHKFSHEVIMLSLHQRISSSLMLHDCLYLKKIWLHSILFWKLIKTVWSNLSLTTVSLRERGKHQKQKTGYTGETGSDQKSRATGAEIKNTLRDSSLRSKCFKLLRKLRQGKACRCFI